MDIDIFLPVSKEEKKFAMEIDHEYSASNERILFVDDEPSIARLGNLMLTRLGYDVTVSHNPLNALGILKDNPQAYDLVISDMTMPQMTGDRFAEEVFKIRPGMPFVLCTGYSQRITSKKIENLGIREVLYKPIDKKDLAEVVRRNIK